MANRISRTFLRVALFVWTVLAISAGPDLGGAQELGLPNSAILTISSDRLFSGSEFGRRIAAEIESEGVILAAENRKIEAELTKEEQDLTAKRSELKPDEFRVLADAFDAKVQDIRRTQDSKARALGQRNDDARVVFFQAARPVLGALMREASAGVILERSSVFLSANATDITDIAISRINDAIGDGTNSEQRPNE